MSNNSTTDPSKVLQDFAVGCDNPNAPPVGAGDGGNLGGGGDTGSAAADPDPFIFDSVLTGTITSANASIDYSGSISIQSEADALHLQASTDIFVSAGAGVGGAIFLTTNGEITHASETFNVEANFVNIATLEQPTFYNSDDYGNALQGGATQGAGGINMLTAPGGRIQINAGNGTSNVATPTLSHIDVDAFGGNLVMEAVAQNGVGGHLFLSGEIGLIDFDNTPGNPNLNLDVNGDIYLTAGGLTKTIYLTAPVNIGDTVTITDTLTPTTLMTLKLPTSDPHILDALYAVSGFVRISAG